MHMLPSAVIPSDMIGVIVVCLIYDLSAWLRWRVLLIPRGGAKQPFHIVNNRTNLLSMASFELCVTDTEFQLGNRS